ncbi:MAG TPA: tetratricopeptide repeat protein [Fimbriiglobus sp.]|jgi:tetratricopeptide (TPR) repeat protein
MSERSTPTVPTPTAEQRKIAADNFERARQVIATGNFDYGIDLLMTCCRLDPANVTFRSQLRKAQKEKFGNDLRGSKVAVLTTLRFRQRLKTAKLGRDYLKVIEYGEHILAKNPWDMGTQVDMSEAFDALGLLDLAVYTLDQARQKYPKDGTLNRALARLLEKRGNFPQAMKLWQLVKEAYPTDVEAAHKAKDLAASDTIARGGYAETAAGSKSSPALDNMEAHAVEHQDRAGREAGPILKRIEADPTEPALYVQLSGVYRKYGQDDRARAVLQQGLGRTGNHTLLQLELAELDLAPLKAEYEAVNAKIQQKKTQLAADDTAEDDGPSLTDLRVRRSLLEKDILTREVSQLKARSDRAPADLSTKFELGTKLYKSDRFDDAIVELQQVRKEEKYKGRAALYLGHCFRKRNNWRLAQRNYEDALAAIPESDEAAKKDVLYHLAIGAAEHGDLPRALDLGHELANLDFTYKGIGNLLDEWQAKVGA